MRGHRGPYVQTDGPFVWVPRAVPWREARSVAQEANQNGDRLVYRGKVADAELLGFTRDCRCDEVCERRYRENDDLTYTEVDRTCLVPAWKFELVDD